MSLLLPLWCCFVLLSPIEADIYRPIKDVHNNGARITVYGSKGWLPEDLSKLKLYFSPPLVQNEDFTIWEEASKHTFPEYMKQLRRTPLALHVLLKPGAVWVKNMDINTTLDLRLINVRNGNKDLHGYKSPIKGKEDVVARVCNYPEVYPTCPQELVLPGASAELQRKIDNVLHHCQAPWFIESKYLKWRNFHTYELLTMQPNIMFINATGQELRRAAKNVDRFLAAHSVMDVVWEPIHSDEPRFWVLMPRPLGMPGHLFGMLDALQWSHHDMVASPARRCTDPKVCIGCTNTHLAGITGSGYSADAFNIYSVLREGFLRNIPVQAFPSTLGIRSTPPIWEGVQGWTYSFNACKSNFLDCYFLDHSPCPRITYNINDPKNKITVNTSRLQMPPIANQEMRPPWWVNLVGKPTDKIPERSIRDLSIDSVPARMAFYSYFFRPNYQVRSHVYNKIQEFNLLGENDVCAAMHVRRGDVIFHQGAARYYITVETYMRSALPYIKSLGINTVLLLTDSQAVIDEALKCEQDYPDVCRGIKWRFIEKKRWYGAEGGWENPFPSGSAEVEFMNIQEEYTLAQKCDLMIMGNSGYGDLVFNHMCCGFPLHDRGATPQRCLCPPKVRVEQGGFTCENGNTIVCDDKYADRGGDITMKLDDPRNTRGANFSKTKDVFQRQGVKVWLSTGDQHMEQSYMLDDYGHHDKVTKFVDDSAKQARRQVCGDYDAGLTRRVTC